MEIILYLCLNKVVGIVDHHGISSSFSSSLPIYCKIMKGAKEVAEAAFGRTTHDNCIVLDHKVSRKTDFIPAITKVLEGEE